MKRYVMFCSSAPHWLQLGRELKEKNVALPCLWLGDDAHVKEASSLFGKQNVKTLSDLRYRAGSESEIDYEGEFVGFFLSDRYAFCKDICLKMMDRIDDVGFMSRLDREVWHHNVLIWGLKHLKANPPDCLIMSEAPHNHAQYAIYEICIYLGIPILKYSAYMPVPVLTAQVFQQGVFAKLELRNSSPVLQNLAGSMASYIDSTLERLENHEDPYHLRVLKEKSSSISFRLSQMQAGLKASFRFLKYPKTWLSPRIYEAENPFRFWWPIAYLFIRLRRRFLVKELKTNASSVVPKDFNTRRYLYYPLHYEPERTTNPDGGRFQDQLIDLLLLRKVLDKDTLIVVKEHPSQFLAARTGYRGRSPLFYRQLKNIRGLVFLNANVSSAQLLRDAWAVATISGTVGFEAACLGKPCVLFGETWFKGMPNVKAFDSNLNLEDAIPATVNMPQKIHEYFRGDILKFGIPGFQNLSTVPRIATFLDPKFYEAQGKGLLQSCEKFFNVHVR